MKKLIEILADGATVAEQRSKIVNRSIRVAVLHHLACSVRVWYLHSTDAPQFTVHKGYNPCTLA